MTYHLTTRNHEQHFLLQVVSEKWVDFKVEITLEQNRFLSDGSDVSDEDSAALWSIPLLFATTGKCCDDMLCVVLCVVWWCSGVVVCERL